MMMASCLNARLRVLSGDDLVWKLLFVRDFPAAAGDPEVYICIYIYIFIYYIYIYMCISVYICRVDREREREREIER